MKRLWTMIDSRGWKAATKYTVCLWVLALLFAAAGALAWAVLRTWTLGTVDWMIVFIGYPAILSLPVVFFYSCRHDFHTGAAESDS